MLKKLLLLLVLLPVVAHADAIQQLKGYFQSTTSLRAAFSQTVLDRQGRKVQAVSGNLQLQRPGRFRWDYDKPYVQHIVGDGQKVWLYDPELNQVTVRPLDKALGSSPAALLAGGKEIDKTFGLKEVGREGQLDWVEVTPKSQESSFEKMLFGFNESGLQEMEWHDHFGQTTVIVLSGVERNPKLDPKAFKFTPPPDADVVGE